MDTQQLKLILTADASGVTGATSTAQRGVERFGAAVGQMDKAWQANAKSARATSASLAQVNMQMTDIVVSLASGQQPLTVLLQQGGQLKDMFGGVAGALSAVGNAVGAMITPTTLAASALAGLAAAAYAGAEADLAVSRSLQEAGGYAGITADQFKRAAVEMAAASKTTESAAESVGLALVSTGRMGSEAISELGAATLNWSRLSGKSTADVLNDVKGMTSGISDWATKHNAAMHFARSGQIDYVRELEQSGQAQKAMVEVGRLLNEHFAGQVENLGLVERAWRGVTNALSGYKSAIMEIGRTETTGEVLKGLEQDLAAVQRRLGGMSAAWDGVAITQAKNEEARLQARIRDLQIEQRDATVRAANRAQAIKDDEEAGKRKEKLRQLTEDLSGANSAYARDLKAIQAAREAGDITEARRVELLTQLATKYGSSVKETTVKAREQDNAFAQLEQRLRGDVAKAYADAQVQAQGLSSAQAAFLALAASADWAKLTNAQRAQTAALFEGRIAQEANNAATAAGAALKRELATIEARAAQVVLDETASVAEHVKRLEDETARMGATTEQLAALEAARIAEALATAEATLASKIAAGARAEELEGVTLLVEELRKLQGAQAANAGKQAAVNTANEWKKAANDMEQSITDALFRAFESGKGFAQSFRDVLVNAFKTQVIKPLISNLLSSVTGGGGGGFNLGSLASLFGGSGSADFLAGMRGASLSTGLAGPTTAGAGGLMGAGAGAGGAMSSLSSFGPYAAAIYAGMQLSGGAFDQGFNARNLPWTKAWLATGGIAPPTLKLDTMLLEKLGINSRLANQITGASLWSRAFGRSDKQTQGTGLQGLLSGGALSGGQAYSDWLQKGGWFRSDKRGTDLSALSEEQSSAINQSAKQVLTEVTGYLDALQLPASSLAGITYDFKVALGDNAEENAAALNKVFAGYQDKLADSVAGVLQPLRKAGETATDTLKRLAGLQVFSGALNDLGGVFSRIANSSVAAREELIGLAGGMDALMQQAMGFAQNYYNAPEIAGIKASEIQRVLAEAGITQDLSSKEQFRALVEGIDPATTSGREQLAALLKVQGDFAQVADYLATAGGTLGSTAAQAPASGPLASLFAQQGSGAEQQVAATNAVANGVDLVRQAIETLTAVVQAGAAMVPATSGVAMREPWRWEVQA